VEDGRAFDELSRRLASPLSRRGVFKAAGLAAGGAVAATLLKPFRASAATGCERDVGPGATACGDLCCVAGTTCLDPSTGRCSCPGGTQTCGQGCCGATCSQASTNCCCPAGTTPCGTQCCNGGIACLSASKSICGCPSGKTPCGSAANLTCCPAGTACGNARCQPVANFTTGAACCTGYQAPCTSGAQCCSGVCSSSKGNRCGCSTNADCPSSAPVCRGEYCSPS
jgi:hypothetical protein